MNRKAARRIVLAVLLLPALAGCMAGRPAVPGEVQSMSGLADLQRIRSANGLAALAPDPTFEKAAAEQAGLMAAARAMKHTTARGRDFQSRMHANGITAASAENVAHAAEVGTVFAMWARSAPHRRNMLDPRFSRFGLASAPDGAGRRYWALVLGR